MKEVKILVPELPESINHAIIVKWNKNIGDLVLENEVIVEIETDKIVLEIPAPQKGYLKSKLFKKHDIVKSKEIIGYLSYEELLNIKKEANISERNIEIQKYNLNYINKKIFNCLRPSERRKNHIKTKNFENKNNSHKNKENSLNNINKNNNLYHKPIKNDFHKSINIRKTKIINMSPIRKKITERLRFSQKNMVMLTTFNEVNLKCIINIRKKYQENFLKKFKIKLGYMSFFVKAVTKALQEFPDLNASIENKKIIYHEYYDINIAISTNRGLITPILKNTNLMSMSDIEKAINNFSKLGETGKLSLNDLQSGTFTITNGGVFGSLLSTPIINPPQVAILGMHFIKNRPMVSNKNIIKILPMMYLALSYDHQLIDGKQAIEFLNYIKNIIEDFSRISLSV